MSFRCAKISLFIIAAALGSMMVGGCASNSRSHAPVEEKHPKEPVTPDRVPAAARLQVSGTGEKSFRAKNHGRAWLFDDDRKTVVYSALLDKGDRITVTPRQHKATVNGEDIGVNDIFERNKHAIYFLALKK